MDRKPIEYKLNTDLQQGEYYSVKVSEEKNINFIYDKAGNEAKPFQLDNNCRLDHIPTLKDIGINNLHPVSVDPKYTEEERKEITRKAGTLSQSNQLKRKTFKESLELFLSLGINKEQLRGIDSSITAKIPQDVIEKMTQEDLITLKAIELSQLGSEKHQTFVRDTVGEKPTDKTEVTADIMTDGDRALLNKLQDRLNV